MEKIGVGQLLDPGMQKRITGMSVDFLLVASVMGISFVVLTKYLGVIIAVTVAVTIVTFLLIEFFRRKVSELGPERAGRLCRRKRGPRRRHDRHGRTREVERLPEPGV